MPRVRRATCATCRAGERRENRAATCRGGTPPPLPPLPPLCCVVVSCRVVSLSLTRHRSRGLVRLPLVPYFVLRIAPATTSRHERFSFRTSHFALRTSHASLDRCTGQRKSHRSDGALTAAERRRRRPAENPCRNRNLTPAYSPGVKRSDRVRPECPGGTDSEQETVRRTGTCRDEDTSRSDPGQHASVGFASERKTDAATSLGSRPSSAMLHQIHGERPKNSSPKNKHATAYVGHPRNEWTRPGDRRTSNLWATAYLHVTLGSLHSPAKAS